MAKGTVNKVILVGRLGADPDIRYSANGMAIARLSVATTERVPAGEGNWEDKTEWHRVVVFGKLAETCGNYLSKGRLVYLEGSLRTQQWEDKEGVKRYTTEIVARDMTMLGSSEEHGQQGQGGGGYARGGSAQSPASRPATEDLPPPSGPPDDDIPF